MKKALSILALALVALTASAYNLTVGTNEHGQLKFMVNNAEVTTAQEGDEVTVTITPDEGWSVGTVTGQWIAVEANAPRRAIDLLSDFTLSPVANTEDQWTFTMERANVEISVKYIKIIQDTWIQDIPSVTYTGSAKTPSVTVKDGDYTLVEDKDYTVTYSNNTNAGTATATVTGKGNYTGSVSKNFTINKASRDVTFTPYQFTRTFGDPDFTIVPTTSGGGILSYSSNDISIATVNSSTGKVHIVGVGKVRITARLSGSSNYRPASDWYEVTW